MIMMKSLSSISWQPLDSSTTMRCTLQSKFLDYLASPGFRRLGWARLWAIFLRSSMS